MALIVRNLGEGTISSTSSTSPTVLYSPQVATRGALVKNIVLFNITDASNVKVNFKIRPGGATTDECHIAPVDLVVPLKDQRILEMDLTLSGSDEIVAWADSGHGGFVSFVVNGVERDQ